MSSDVSERQHRATRSSQCVAAVVLVVAMAVVAALAVTSVVNPLVALGVNVALAVVASILLYTVITGLRLQFARERAVAAAEASARTRERSAEHIAFVTSLGDQVRQAHADLKALRSRARELEDSLADAQTELAVTRDALFDSEAAEKRARAALVAAEPVAVSGRHLRPA